MRYQIPEEEGLGRICDNLVRQKTRETNPASSCPGSRSLGRREGTRRVGKDVPGPAGQGLSAPDIGSGEETEVPEEEEAGRGGAGGRLSNGAVLWFCLRLALTLNEKNTSCRLDFELIDDSPLYGTFEIVDLESKEGLEELRNYKQCKYKIGLEELPGNRIYAIFTFCIFLFFFNFS